ncbi:MAG: glycoside hydrolase domain-containing protein [Planctomycetota bacterium]
MKLNRSTSSLCLTAALLLTSFARPASSGELYRAPKVSNVIDGVVFEAGNWEPHLAPGAEGSSWGNHRAVVVLDGASGEAVLVTIPWRRRDADPAGKSIVVVDAASNKPVSNALALRVENLSGDVAFQPNPGSKTYAVYYMPWKAAGSYYPRITYPKPASTADPSWERRVRAAYPSNLPRARTTHIQSVNAFHSFFPMEVIASDAETAAFMSQAPDGWALVPEHRDYPVRMRRFLPRHWTEGGHADVFASRVLRGEYFTFQLALVSGAHAIIGVRVAFDGFPAAIHETLTCFNVGGINEKGERFATDVSVPAGTVQPLWIGLEIPESQSPGTYAGEVTVSTADRGSKAVRGSSTKASGGPATEGAFHVHDRRMGRGGTVRGWQRRRTPERYDTHRREYDMWTLLVIVAFCTVSLASAPG